MTQLTFNSEQGGAADGLTHTIIRRRASIIGRIGNRVQFCLAPVSHVERQRRFDRLMLIKLFDSGNKREGERDNEQRSVINSFNDTTYLDVLRHETVDDVVHG